MITFRKFIIKLAHIKLKLEYVNGTKNAQQLAYQLSDISDKKLDGNKWYELDRKDER